MKKTPLTIPDWTLDDLFTAFAAAGMLSARIDERDPDLDRISDMALTFGRRTAAKARRRRAASK